MKYQTQIGPIVFQRVTDTVKHAMFKTLHFLPGFYKENVKKLDKKWYLCLCFHLRVLRGSFATRLQSN